MKVPSAPLANVSTAAAVSSTGKPRVMFDARRLHALDLADDHAQAIDVVDRVDQDRSAAGLAPPGDIEIVVGLAVQPVAVHGDELGRARRSRRNRAPPA